jgi:hypothetical protein
VHPSQAAPRIGVAQVRDPFDEAHQGNTDLSAHGAIRGVEVNDALEIAEKIEV